MAKVSKSIILGYNKCAELATKFTNILDSFWHKDEKIPLSALEEDITVEVVDNLTSTDVDKALSANQGRLLNQQVLDNIETINYNSGSIISANQRITTNEQNITTNASNIATNEQAIADNGVDIASNKNAIENVQIADENGISKFSLNLFTGEKIKFVNAFFDTAEKKVIIPISPISRTANLIIGGMGSSITNSAILASYLTLDVVDILDFQVVDNTVYAIINKNYLFNTDAFKDNLDITSYIDKDGFCLKLSNNAFTGCNNLEKLSIPTPIYDFLFEFTPLLDISTLKNEFITEIKPNTFRNVGGDTSFKLSFPLLQTVGSTAFRNVGFFVDLPNYKILTTGTFGVFQGFSGILNAPKLENLGDPSINKYTFHQCTNTAVLIVNYKLKTANNGQPDADLVIAEANGATIIYVGYSELFDEISKLNLRQYASDSLAAAGNIAIGEPYVNSTTGAIHLRQPLPE